MVDALNELMGWDWCYRQLVVTRRLARAGWGSKSFMLKATLAYKRPIPGNRKSRAAFVVHLDGAVLLHLPLKMGMGEAAAALWLFMQTGSHGEPIPIRMVGTELVVEARN